LLFSSRNLLKNLLHVKYLAQFHYAVHYDILRRAKPTNPIKPVPNNTTAAGTGTVATPAVIVKLEPSAANKAVPSWLRWLDPVDGIEADRMFRRPPNEPAVDTAKVPPREFTPKVLVNELRFEAGSTWFVNPSPESCPA
jgi:hypothetical protein